MQGGLDEKTTKIYAPDTNVLVNNPYAVFLLSGNKIPEELLKEDYGAAWNLLSGKESPRDDPNHIFISDIVEKELNNIKDNDTKPPIIQFSSRRALRILEFIRSYGNILEGIKLPNSAIVWKDIHDEQAFSREKIFASTNDDRIIYGIHRVAELNKNSNAKIIFVSMDSNARSRAADKKISTEEFKYEQISDEELYTGYIEIKGVSQRDLERIQKYDVLQPGTFSKYFSKEKSFGLKSNQVVVFSASSTMNAYYISDGPGKPLRSLRRHDSFFNSILKSKSSAESLSEEEMVSFLGIRTIYESVRDNIAKKKRPRLESRIENLAKAPDKQCYFKDAEFILKALNQSRLIPELEKYCANDNFEMNNANGLARFNIPFNKTVIPKNLQSAYVELLLNKEIGVLSVIGTQGTGKTYFAMECGLELIKRGVYERIKYITPLVSIGGELGFLPGGIPEKTAPWMEAFNDNLEEIFDVDNIALSPGQRKSIKSQICRLEDDVYSFDVATYIKGRTIKNRFVIIDEAHFFTRDQIKVLLGRIGRNSKVVFMGDPKQINAGNVRHYLTEKTSGLVHIVSKLPGASRLYAHITLPDSCSERSQVAKLANIL